MFYFHGTFYYDLASLKNSFYNFERTMSTQTEATMERCSGKYAFLSVLKTTENDLKSTNTNQIHVKGFIISKVAI